MGKKLSPLCHTNKDGIRLPLSIFQAAILNQIYDHRLKESVLSTADKQSLDFHITDTKQKDSSIREGTL